MIRSRLVLLYSAFFVVVVYGSCPVGELSCENGQCISSPLWCDKNTDCVDSSDEAYCKKARWFISDPNDCKDFHLLCEDGKCVPLEAECNGYPDCKDGSDEQGCGNSDEDKTLKEDETSGENSEETSDPIVEVESVFSGIQQTPSPIITNEVSSPTQERHTTKMQNTVSTQKTYETTTKEPLQIDARTSRNTDVQRQTNAYTQRPYTPYPQHSSSPYPQRPSYHQPVPTPYPQRPPYPQPITHPQRPSYHQPVSTPYPQRPSYHQPGSTPYPQRPYHQPGSTPYPQRPPYRQTEPTPYPQRPPNRQPESTYLQRPPYRYPESTPYPQRPQHRQPEPSSYPQRPPHRQPEPSSYPQRPPQRQPESTYLQRPPYPNPETGAYYHQRPQPYAPYPSHQLTTPRYSRIYNDHYLENGLAQNYPVTYSGRRKTTPRIYFLKNYTRIYERANEDCVRRGTEWLLGLRDQSGGWGKDTPRALVALSLLNNSFVGGTHENDLMKKYFQAQLGVKLLSPKTLGPNQLAGFVNALLATCQDPKDFHGIDVLQLLGDSQKEHSVSPFVFLSLCLANERLSSHQEHALLNILRGHLPTNDQGKDMLSLAISAFACYFQQLVTPSSRDSAYIKSISEILNNATSTLLQLQLDNGSFGSVYSTALAAQALLSANDSRGWNPEATLQYLRDQQASNGSFGDFLATYYVLPVLRGRSLLHLRNTLCHNDTYREDLTPQEILNHVGPKQFIRYSLHFGLPLSNAYSVKVHVPRGISFFDVMRVAEFQNKHFNFLYEKKNETIRVYSISDVPNDWERGLAWHLYVRRNSDTNVPRQDEAYTRDIKELFPRSDEHVIFWYHKTGIRL